MEPEHAVSNRMIGYGEPFELALSCQPGFDNVALHVATRVKWIRKQRPSYCPISSRHPAKFISWHVRTRSKQGPFQAVRVNALNSTAATSIQAAQKSSNRRRSKISAIAPAGSPNRRTGKVAAVCMREMSNGDVVRAVISHVPAVSCIQLPVLEIIEAMRRSRKTGLRKGTTQGEFTCGCAWSPAMVQSWNGNIG